MCFFFARMNKTCLVLHGLSSTDIIDSDGVVWHVAYIQVGQTGGLFDYIRGWCSDFRPPVWAFRYSVGKLISNSGPALKGICVFHPSAGIYEGSVATVDGEFASSSVKIQNELIENDQTLYNRFDSLNGQIIRVEYRV